jgi:hypothetical protein
VRWRIGERDTGKIYDPFDAQDGAGGCLQPCDATQRDCANAPRWRVTRVHLVLADTETGAEVPAPPAGLDSNCDARELTTPFTLPEGLFSITLRAFDPAMPELVQAESPSPELRVLRRGEIVNLDIVVLAVLGAPP